MPTYFRIDEFRREPQLGLSIRDKIRFACFGFDQGDDTPRPPIIPVSQRLRYTLDPFDSSRQSVSNFRIDEFKKTPNGVIDNADRWRYTGFGFSIPNAAVGTGGVPVEARNVSLRITWQSSVAKVVLYQLGISYIPRADETKGRPTDWDAGGTLADKYIKGVIVEADTLGVERTVNVWVDGDFYTALTVPATTKGRRQIFQFSFAETKGRYFRLVPADISKWQLFQYQWIFDEEPLELLRWETQELTHGVAEWKAPLFANVTLRSTAMVELQITVYNQSGTSIQKTYTIPSTNGIKQKPWVPFEATKGILVKYLLTSTEPFALYREETDVAIMPWGGEQFGIVKPFGNDDLDLTRGMYRASGVAERQGGGEGGSRSL